MAEPVWCCGVMVEAASPHWLHPTSILDIQSVWAPWDAEDHGHIGTHLSRITYAVCRWGWILWKMGYGQACMMFRYHGWGCKPPLTASHIHIELVQSVCAPWDAVDWHMGTHLSRITCAGGGESLGNGVWPSLYDVAVSWLRLHVLSVLAASDPLLDFRWER